MEKKNLIIFSFGIIIGLVFGAYLCFQVFHSEIIKAYTAKPANGHTWSEMECNSGLCITTDNKIGVGVDNPTEKLQVVGNVLVVGDICNGSGNCLSALASITNACGPAAKNYAYTDSAYSGKYCSIGSPTPATPAFPAAGGSTTWTCPVVNGSPVSCTATRTGAPVAGACGSANGTSSYSSPSTGLCTKGTPTTVTQSGYSFYWSCVGQSGGSTATCSSNLIANGSCGSSGPYPSLSSGTCGAGSPNNFSGSGPWTWTCSGVNGGTAASCTAHYGHTSCAGIDRSTGYSGSFSHDGTTTTMCGTCYITSAPPGWRATGVGSNMCGQTPCGFNCMMWAY